MKKFDHYKVKEREKENLQKNFFIPKNKSIYKVEFKEKIPFNFIYTSLNQEFKADLKKVLKKEYLNTNAFIYAKESFSLELSHLLNFFPSKKDLPCFSKNHSINIFLAKDFDEFCSIGSSKKRNLPSFAQGRVFGTTLIYLQKYFLDNSKKNNGEIPKSQTLGNAHELLHIFFHYNHHAKYGKLNYQMPFLLNEGLEVICANQISKKFEEKFISAEHLFLENHTNAFEYDKRWITDNRYYQSAGHFMDYLLKIISKKENIKYKESFQKVFSTLGCHEGFNKNERKFNSEKYFKEIFNLDITKEYNSFLEKKRP